MLFQRSAALQVPYESSSLPNDKKAVYMYTISTLGNLILRRLKSL